MSISNNSTNLILDTKRHSFAHLMAAAVGKMFPEAQFGVGPVIENGCYYDFVLPRTLIPEDLVLLEGHLKEMLKAHLSFKVQELDIDEAIAHFDKANQPLKVELLMDLKTKGTTSMSEEEKADFGGGEEVAAEQIQSETQDLTINTYNLKANEYIEKTTSDILTNWLDKVISHCSKSKTIFEIGTGTGRDANYFESKDIKIIRSDVSQSFLDYNKSNGHEIIRFNSLNTFCVDKQDLIFANAVLLHFNNSEFVLALKNIYKSLNEEGIFAFSVKKGFGDEVISDKMNSPRYFNYWQESDLEKILKQNGFEVCSLESDEKWIQVICKKTKSIPKITLYRIVNESTGEILFEDLCKGPHIAHVKEIKNIGFKLDKFSAAYWRGDQARGINMQRLYALVYDTKEELADFVNLREEAKKRDHRVLGASLKLFTISELVGSGFPLFQPKGAIVRKLLEDYLWQLQKHTHQRVYTPHLTKQDLYDVSGHAGKYLDDMFSVYGGTSKENFYVKPMNCPMHMQIFDDNQFSYKDMPIRYFDPTTVYRDEKTGQLSGLTRVRSITQDDGHIFCRVEQIQDEFTMIVKTIREFYGSLGMTPDWVSWSVRDSSNPDKYLGDPANWDIAEEAIRKAAEVNDLTYKRMEGEAAFYGPKLDFMFKDCIGREWQLSTIQCDFVQPERFNLSFVNEQSEKERPVVIHRAISGSLERFMGILIEHFAGKFPFWLAPEQIRILTLNDAVLPFVDKVKAELDEVVLMKPLKYNELRYTVDDRMETLGKKIRDAKLELIPMLIVIGPKDVEAGEVSVEYAGKSFKVKVGSLEEILEVVG